MYYRGYPLTVAAVDYRQYRDADGVSRYTPTPLLRSNPAVSLQPRLQPQRVVPRTCRCRGHGALRPRPTGAAHGIASGSGSMMSWSARSLRDWSAKLSYPAVSIPPGRRCHVASKPHQPTDLIHNIIRNIII